MCVCTQHSLSHTASYVWDLADEEGRPLAYPNVNSELNFFPPREVSSPLFKMKMPLILFHFLCIKMR